MVPIIELENVWKVYDMGKVKVEALRGMSLKINKGDFISLIGKSGSGKSTAMNMIGALDIPTKGKIFLKGKDIATLSENQLSLLRGKTIGFVFQQFNLIPSLTALENVALPMIFQKISKEDRTERATKLLNSVGLEKRMHHRPSKLSGGEQQRVAIARALVNNPEIVLADEPTGNLDSLTGKMVMQFLIDLHKKQNKTLLIVSHDKSLAKNAKRILHIKDGKLAR